MIYTWRYPKSIHRSVMIGVNPPGNFLWDARRPDEQIDRYAALCAAGRRVQRADARPRRVDRTTTLARHPDHWWFLPIKPGNVAGRRRSSA